MDDDARRLLDAAKRVLDDGWTGAHTVPSRSQYPHQWSWDSCFHAIAYAQYDTHRAMTELRSLFRGQWQDGRVPHIVFDPDHVDGDYMPGPEHWDTARSKHAPRDALTSSIVQPAVHATAVFNTWFHARDDHARDARGFLEEMFPKLVRWHDFLHRERDPDGSGLLAIRHPWESGRDNSPLWDDVYASWRPSPEDVPAYERVDSKRVDADERPTDEQYDRFMALVKLSRDCSHDERELRRRSPFLVEDALFNGVMARADHDLGRIARALGKDPAPFEARSWRVTDAMNERLWRGDRHFYASRDARRGTIIDLMSAAGFTPLFANVPTPERAVEVCGQLDTNSFCPRDDEDCWAVPSFDRENPGYSADRYWKGPVWLNVNWLIYDGLMRYGLTDYAARIRRAIRELPLGAGFREYYDPETGKGHGTDGFGMTAAVVIETLLETRDARGRIAGTADT